MSSVQDAGAGSQDEEEDAALLEPGLQTAHLQKGHPSVCVQAYIRFGEQCRTVVESERFSTGICSVVIFAAGLVGAQTYDSLSKNAVLLFLDQAVLVIFIIEFIMKLVAEPMHPYRYFFSAWNVFDFLIVVGSLPIFPMADSAIALRLLRLARIAKLFDKVENLRIVLQGLHGGMRSIASIMFLLTFALYMYGIAGVHLFRQNDPWHFQSVPRAMLSLFRCATLCDRLVATRM